MLVIEGCDLVGKTTLAKTLVKRFETLGPYTYAHFGRLPEGWQFPNSYAPRMSRFIVQDRFHMSEVVYRCVRGEETMLGPEGYRVVDAWLRLLGGFTVVIIADPQWMRCRLDELDREEMYTPEQMLQANAFFRGLVYGDRFASYRADHDMIYECNSHQPWPAENETLLKHIVDRYAQRQEELEKTLTARRAILESL